ncbi:MAG TPA: WYL domain-containing protein, partial [Gammaproteobacteria bacterium]|nr:WYL domain-containing protein [Gammaproteobacteria bacterium]
WKGGKYELQIPYSDERELLMEILKYGPDVEVIAPEELRNKVSQYLQQAIQHYQTEK